MRHLLSLALLVACAAAAARPLAAEEIVGPIGFSLETTDHRATLTGELALPGGVACVAPKKDDKKGKLPVAILVPGSGEFDRDEDFGVSGTEKDLLFRQLAWDLLSSGIAVVRFDYRGVHCNRFALPKRARTPREEFLERCVDSGMRKSATPEAMRADLKQVYDYAVSRECVDPKNLILIAHSEGSFHAARLIRDGAISPKALVLIGGVAESPKSLVHWQAVDRPLGRIMRGASDPERITNAEVKASGAPESELSPKGYWTRDELKQRLEADYEKARAQAMAEKDDGPLHQGFWPQSWWKMWWSDETRVVDELRGYKGEIVAHGGAEDTQVPQQRQFDLLRGLGVKDAHLVLHPGLGHSLGRDGLKGPMDPDALARVAEDVAKLAGTKSGEIYPLLTSDEIAARPYMGVGFAPSEELPAGVRQSSKLKSSFGLLVTGVTPGLPAWEAGIRKGDLLLSLDGEEIGSVPKDDAAVHFTRRFQALKPGSVAHIALLRWKTQAAALKDGAQVDAPSLEQPANLAKLALSASPGKSYDLSLKRGHEVVNVQVPVRLPRKFDESKHPAPEKQAVERLAERVSRHYRMERRYADLLQRISDMTARPDPFRLEEADFIQHHPFTLASEAKRMARAVVPAGQERLPAFPLLSEAWVLRFPAAGALARPEPLKTGLKPEEHLAQIKALLADSDKAWKEAFRELKDDEIAFLRDNLDGLARKTEEWNYVYADESRHRLEQNERVVALLSKVDLAPLIRAAASLSRLADPVYVRALKRDLERAGKDLSAPEVLSEKTPFGEILIGGAGDNSYTDLDRRQVAVLIDLGGNDYYANRVASSSPQVHASVVVDLGGDDVYESNQDYAQGSGFAGVGILADLGGNDSYAGVRGAQGTGFGGVGLLIDSRGDDVYRAHSFSQGTGFFGLGGLIDSRGDDRYESRLLSQAVGIGGGIGALIDLRGDDHYYSKGYLPSGYGTPGTYEGWSQGVGVGLRFLASGGVGLLYDGQGRDVMEGGDFSQGGGYYFGLGILDAEGNEGDRYIGSRYSQGFAAHSALGAFFDAGGDDYYASRGMVSTGNANDLSVAWFEDGGGSDRYPAKHFSLGASANNSLCVFLDRGGRDRFEGSLLPGSGQENDYHGGRSLSLFVASGPEPRAFGKAPRLPVDAHEGDRFSFVGGKSVEDWLSEPDRGWPELK